jgi:hypothetical protein
VAAKRRGKRVGRSRKGSVRGEWTVERVRLRNSVNVERIEEEENKKSEFETETRSGRSSSKPLVEALTTIFCSSLTSSDRRS